MALESILEHIINKAKKEEENIIQEAELQADKIIQEAKLEAEKLYREILNKEKALAEAEKQKLVVNARLEEKMNLLKAKQELINDVFNKLKSALAGNKFKKQQVLTDKVKEVPEDIDFYLTDIRQENEAEIAGMLFP